LTTVFNSDRIRYIDHNSLMLLNTPFSRHDLAVRSDALDKVDKE